MKFLILIGTLAAAPNAPDRGAFGIPLERDEEIRMALSAGPEHLRAGAGVYVLGDRGFEKVRESGNGFHCLVERDGASILAPICFDAEGSETLLKVNFRSAELVLSGKSSKEASAIVDSELASGKLLAPRKPGIAYMLSTDFRDLDEKTGEWKTVYPPHVMFYAPYLRNADLGIAKEHLGSTGHPWILNEGKPGAYIIVVPDP
jgi:hypothetical protein